MMNIINKKDQELLLEDETYYLKINEEEKYELRVKKNCHAKLIIIGNSDYELKIMEEENSALVVNSINKDNNVKIDVSLLKNSLINYHHSIVSKNNSHNIFYIRHQENDSRSFLYNNGVNQDEKDLFFRIDGVIPKNLKNIVCNQSSKIINLKKGNSKIIPNLIIDSNDIVANHAAYLGEIAEETKFYLASRGISGKIIEKLIYRATILGNMELSCEKEEFNRLIEEWW